MLSIRHQCITYVLTAALSSHQFGQKLTADVPALPCKSKLKSRTTQEHNASLTHQAREPLERSRDSDLRIDLDEDVQCRLDVHLEDARTGQHKANMQTGS